MKDVGILPRILILMVKILRRSKGIYVSPKVAFYFNYPTEVQQVIAIKYHACFDH